MKRLFGNPWVRLLGLITIAASLVWIVYLLRGIVTPFAVSFALAYFLNPPVNALERLFNRALSRVPWLGRRVQPRAIGVGVLVFALVLLLVTASLFVIPAVVRQVSEATQKFPGYLETLRIKIEPAYQRLNLQYPEQTEQIRRNIMEIAKNNLPRVVSPLTHALQAAFSSALGFALTVLNLVLIPVFAAYLLYDMNRIRAGAKDLVPPRFRPYVFSRISSIDRQLAAFARGQITVCLLLGSFYGIALTVRGVPMGLIVGFVVGFFNLIPNMSFAVGLPLTLLLTWLDGQGLQGLLIVAGIFAFGQFVEGNFITPRIVGQSLGLHTVVIMLAVLVGGSLFGFIGMLVAVPTTAALSVFWTDLKDAYLRSELYRGRDSVSGISSRPPSG